MQIERSIRCLQIFTLQQGIASLSTFGFTWIRADGLKYKLHAIRPGFFKVIQGSNSGP